jgi:non-heme chloroperoxidase
MQTVAALSQSSCSELLRLILLWRDRDGEVADGLNLPSRAMLRGMVVNDPSYLVEKRMRSHKLTLLTVILVSGLALSAFALAQTGSRPHPRASQPVFVKTPDGLTISAQDWGNANGPEIVFIHGFSQSHLSWIKQVTSDLANEFHMVTYDLRGHGNSDKPFQPERYRDSKAWADELQAVMDATGVKRPVLAGWSYGGRIMADYLEIYGPAKLAGLNYVDTSQKSDPTFIGPNLKNLPLMTSEDLATNIAATRAFLRDCFSKQPTQEEYETMLSFNMMVPPKVRAGLSGRSLDILDMDDILKSLKLPVLVTHGSEDKNLNLVASEYTAKMIPGAKLSVYQGIGHSPFFEDPARFNAELATFVRNAQRG